MVKIDFDKIPHAGDMFKRANDKDLIEVSITFSFPVQCVVDEIYLSMEECEVSGGFLNGPRGKSSYILFSLVRNIPKSLFNEIDRLNARAIILGYIYEVLPNINNEIVKQKSNKMNLLLKRYSMLDIVNIVVADNDGNTYKIDWPTTMGDFPFDKVIDDIYFHDLINAIQSFFETDYNEAIRKLVTSLDSYMKKNKWEGKYFKTKLDLFFEKGNSFVKTIIAGIKNLYDIRNDIVHESKSLNPDDRWFVDFSIGCVFYFYKFVSDSESDSDFFLQLEMHYSSLKHMILGLNLSNFVKDDDRPIKTINNAKDIDDMMESKFTITDDVVEGIKNNLLNTYF